MQDSIFNHSVGVLSSKELSESVAIAQMDNRSEGLGVDTVSGASKTQDTNMMRALAGALLVCIGFTSYFVSRVVPDISLNNRWNHRDILRSSDYLHQCDGMAAATVAARVVAFIGGAASVTLIIFGFLLVTIPVAVLYWDVVHRIRTSDETGALVEW